MARFENWPAVVGRCWCCGEEIYSMRDLDLYDGMCEECFLATEDEDAEAEMRQHLANIEHVNRIGEESDRLFRERMMRDG